MSRVMHHVELLVYCAMKVQFHHSGVIRLQYCQGHADIELLEVLQKVSRAAAAEQIVLAHLQCDTIYSVQNQTRGQTGRLTVRC